MSEISKSKQKRLNQKNARKEQKKKKAISTMWAIFIPLLIVGLIVGIYFIYQSTKLNYEKYLNADGTIQSGKATINYSDMSFSKADLLPSDETIQNDIDSQLEEYKFISENADLEIAEGDSIKVSYDEMANGDVVNSVSAEEGMDIIVGYGSINAALDEELIGHKAGDTVTLSIPYPDDYEDETLAGQSATYIVNIMGIYEVPEFDDAFVQTNLSEEASSAAEYKQNLIDKYYKDNLTKEIESYIKENLVADNIPDNYIANLEKIYYKQNEENFNYYNSMYYSYLGYYMYDSIYGMYGYETEEEYNEFVHEQAIEDTKYALALQSIYYNENMTNTADEVKATLFELGYDDASYSEATEKYGKKYLAHQAITTRVLDHLCDIVNITE